MAISPDIIDDIKQAAQIEDVIGDFVTLKKKGHYMMACCPFHHEKTPSFTVTPAKGIYKCFGCGKAGDSLQFVMDIEGLNYPEALKYLAAKYGIDLKEEETTPEEQGKQTERESLYIVLAYASKYFEDLLWENEEGKAIGLSYFKERGFSQNTIKKFNLGYTLEEWDALTKVAIKDGYNPDNLVKAGLSIESEDKTKSLKIFDRFRGRVTFPIHNLTGKVIGFGARILKTDKKQAKYLNSPETEVYHKSKVLYGLYQAKNAIRQEENCFLVEGYTDVISLHQGGIENVVASSGTSLTEDQIKLVKRFSENITVLFDGDSAGIKASLRGIDMILSEGLNVKIVTFPENEDPDSYIKKVGGAEFKEYINQHSKDFITFRTELSLKAAGQDPLKKAEVIREIVDSISKIPDSIKRAVFFRQCSQMLDIDEGVLIAEFNKIQLKDRQKKKEELSMPPEAAFTEALQEEIIKKESDGKPTFEGQEREIVRLLLKYGNEPIDTINFAKYILSEIEDTQFQNPIYNKIIEQIRTDVKDLGVVREQIFISHVDANVRSVAIELITERFSVSENWERHEILVPKDQEILASMGYSTILRLKFRSMKFMIRENMQEIQKAEKENQDLTPLLNVHIQLKETEKEIAKMLGIVISR